MITPELLSRLRNTRSEEEWHSICQEVKAANGGWYTNDWFEAVWESGIAAEADANWALNRERDFDWNVTRIALESSLGDYKVKILLDMSPVSAADRKEMCNEVRSAINNWQYQDKLAPSYIENDATATSI